MRLHTRTIYLLLSGTCLASCAHSVYNLRIPLSEDPAAVFKDAANVTIDDVRPTRERAAHLGKDIYGCERRFGDDTFHPSKLMYLDGLIAERVSRKTTVHIRLARFDTVEYCQNAGNSGGAAAARNSGARGLPAFNAGAIAGDSVHLRLAGTINDLPFDVSRTFDYGYLEYTFPKTPSSNYTYRALLRDRLDQMADEIVKLNSKS